MTALFADLVAASEEVGATRSRTRKVKALAAALSRLGSDELAVGASFLAGTPRQERLELGWAAIRDTSVAPATDPTLTVLDVHEALDEIAGVSGAGSRTRRLAILEELLARATAPEQQMLRGLVLGELRQGALEGLVVQAVAEAAELDAAAVRRAVMLTGDVGRTAELAVTGGAPALAELRLERFRPVQPMLAQTSPSVAHAVEDLGPVVVEAKLDGARVQAHREGDEIRVYTRNLREVTGSVPEVVAAVRAADATTLVLDGEVIALDADGRPEPFQVTMGRFGQQSTDHGVALSVFFFDVLHVDGRDLLDEPAHARLDVLDAVVPAEHRVERARVDEPGEGEAFLERVLDSGHEGVMVKGLDAPYEAGRRGAAWRKVKPVHTLDLVVLAVERGSGRRRGWLSNLHLGARDPDGGFVMLGKTFKGLTDEMLAWQTERFLELESGREGHVVHVHPEQVVEVAFDGVQDSPRYPAGLALRFARVKGYRPDKPASEADTIDTVRAIRSGERRPRVTG